MLDLGGELLILLQKRDADEWSKTGFLTPDDVGQALLSVCTQTANAHIAELRLAANNCVY